MKSIQLKLKHTIFVVLSLFVVNATFAAVPQSLLDAIPEIDPSKVHETPVEGIYFVDQGPQSVYISKDAKYFFTNGGLINLNTQENYTEVILGKTRREKLAHVDEKNYIVFPAKDKKYSITVFTDLDCSYCRVLHGQIDKYNEMGIEVKYLLRPRDVEGSDTWKKAEAVMCSKDKAGNLTQAKLGFDIKRVECDSTIVSDNVALADSFGFFGTPAVISENGRQLGGYLPPERMIVALTQEKIGILEKQEANEAK